MPHFCQVLGCGVPGAEEKGSISVELIRQPGKIAEFIVSGHPYQKPFYVCRDHAIDIDWSACHLTTKRIF